MKTAKKFLAVLMCAAMLFGSVAMFGGIASAAYEKQEGLLTFKVREDEAVLVSCAQNAMGEITVPAAVGGVPVKRIAGGEFMVSSGAFEGCKGITKLNLPDSIIEIGNSAFKGCSKLAEINIPAGVTEIGDDCFNGCESLKSIDIPGSVKSIGNYAFDGCKELREVIISDSVTEIGYGAFSNCEKLEKVMLPKNLTAINSGLFRNCYSLGSVDIPAGVTVIEDNAFANCTSLESVNIPESVKKIDDAAFIDCVSLKSMELPSGLVSLGRWALSGTALYNNKTNWQDGVLYVGSALIEADCLANSAYTVKTGTRIIADYAFSECGALKSVVLPEGLLSIGREAFDSCAMLASVNIPDSVISVGGDAFYNTQIWNSFKWRNNALYIDNALIRAAENLSGSYTVKPGTTVIGAGAFSDTDTLTEVVIPDSVKFIGIWAFENCDNLVKVTLPNGLERIEEATFDRCYSLKNVNIPESVNYIGNSAFLNCTSLEKIVLPPNLNSINEYVFINCESLDGINIPEGVTRIEYGAFWGCKGIDSVTIPDTVTYIGFEAFAGSDLKSVYIPASVEKIEDNVFGGRYSLEKITVSPENKNYASDGSSALFTKDMRTLIMLPDGTTITEYTIPNGVYTVYPWAINGRVEVVNVPASVDECEDAFRGSQLTAVNVDPANKQYASDEYGVLYNKEMTELLCYPDGNPLDRYRVPDGVTAISDYSITTTALNVISLPASLVDSPPFSIYDNGIDLIYFRGNKDQWENIKNEWDYDGDRENCAPVIIGRDIPEDEARLKADLALANLKTRFALIRANIKIIIDKIIRFLKRIFDSIGIR